MNTLSSVADSSAIRGSVAGLIACLALFGRQGKGTMGRFARRALDPNEDRPALLFVPQRAKTH